MSMSMYQYKHVSFILVLSLFFSFGCGNNSSEKQEKDSAKKANKTESRAINQVKNAKIIDVWPEKASPALSRIDRMDSITARDLIKKHLEREAIQRRTINDVIIDAMHQKSGVFDVRGWIAIEASESAWIVSFSYEEAGVTKGWYFEVMPSINLVRDITKDSTLWRHYLPFLSP